MASADLVQTNGLGLSLASAMKRVDAGLQLYDRGEDAALEPLSGELGKPAFDRIGPRARGRREVEGDAGWRASPPYMLLRIVPRSYHG
jgi:hypothetical protein